MKNLNLGVMYLTAVPLGAALVHFADIDVGGFQLAGWVWILYFLAALILCMAEFALNPRVKVYFPAAVWMVWAVYLWMTLVWCEGLGRRNVQDALQITVPLLVGILASMVVRSREQLLQILAAFAVALGIILVRVVLIRAGVVDPEHSGARIFSITALFIGGLGLAYASEQPWAGYALWAGCIVATAGTGSRTTTGALLILPILNPLHRNITVRMALAACVVVAGIGIFYSPQFQKRFFYEGHGTMAQVLRGEFLSFGRFEAWPHIFAEAMKHPWFGAGVGEVVEFVPTVWPEEDKPHNDYLRIFFETGLVGFLIFWSTWLWQFQQVRRLLRDAQGLPRVALGASALGLWGFAILCLTDNVLIYNLYYNNLLFAVLGATYGLIGAETQTHVAPQRGSSSGLRAQPVLQSKLFPPSSPEPLLR